MLEVIRPVAATTRLIELLAGAIKARLGWPLEPIGAAAASALATVSAGTTDKTQRRSRAVIKVPLEQREFAAECQSSPVAWGRESSLLKARRQAPCAVRCSAWFDRLTSAVGLGAYRPPSRTSDGTRP